LEFHFAFSLRPQRKQKVKMKKYQMREEDKFVIKYASHMLPSAAHGITRFDACFYAGEGFIATVLYEGFAVDIYCDGDTKIYNRSTDQYYTGGADLILGGFDTDTKFHKATEDESLVMDMNSWFDLYCYGEHLDAVTHTLNEALYTAKNYVYQEYFDAETLLDMLDK
jgi:hypothetical protein